MNTHPGRLCVALSALVYTFLMTACSQEVPAPATEEVARSGEAIYSQACAHCHEGQVARAPGRDMLEIMSPESVLRSLTVGVMQQEAAGLSPREREAVAEHLTGRSMALASSDPAPLCAEDTRTAFDFQRPPAASGWGFDPHNTRAIPDEVARLKPEDLNRLELRWAFAFPDASRARSAPGIAGGRLFTGSHNGDVYALDMASGCIHWVFQASAEVRTAIVIEPWEAGSDAEPRLFFGDLLGNVYALSALSGELLWRHRPDPHPNATITGSPSLDGDRLFVPVSSLEVVPAARPDYPCCTFRGSVVAYDIDSGEPVWKTYTIEEEPTYQGDNPVGTPNFGPSGAPIWNSPAIDRKRGLVYAATGENYSSPANETSDAIMAFDRETGAIRWVFQATEGDAWNTACDTPQDANCPEEDGPDFDFGAAVILATASNRRDLLIGGHKTAKVHPVDADTGQLVWHTRVGRGGIQGAIHFG
ncbi:MAG: PQQ-binding-like beta-propeller repeat protein, partial [Gammaproteobacteria bacterium]|nr:PQQ-binding-like beta-propeller repeat protein [Gammaproteobacteria bacterium]